MTSRRHCPRNEAPSVQHAVLPGRYSRKDLKHRDDMARLSLQASQLRLRDFRSKVLAVIAVESYTSNRRHRAGFN